MTDLDNDDLDFLASQARASIDKAKVKATMSKLPRFINVSVPDSDGVMHTVDWMRADIANDLLEALYFAVDSYDPEASSIERALAFYEVVNVARAAIAKAKGEQQ